MIRRETEADWPAIDHVHRQAFGGGREAALVQRLRLAGLVAASLVAEEEGTIVGHLMLSWLAASVEGRKLSALALAPVAVLPDRQGRTIGSRLVRAGVVAARETGAEAIIVLGHPGYYPRFGFSAALASGLAAPFSGKSFMALELVPDVLNGKSGAVRYPPAFALDHSHP
jgi:putative acetyltransferase